MSNISIYSLDEFPENFDFSSGELPEPTRTGQSLYNKNFNIDDIFSIGQLKYISDVTINNINNNDFLVYDNTDSLWINKSPENTILSLGITSLASELNYNDLTLLGTAEASKVLTSDENGLTVLPDIFKLSVGSSEDLQIHHDGTNSLIDNQTGQLRIAAEVASSSEILIGNASSTVLIGQDLTASGVIIGHKDNATALRVKGAAHANDVGNADPDGDVQSYTGIFTNDVYNQASHAGTKNTRFITGGNLGMDVVTQSAHGLHLVAGDGTQTDGEILMASKNGLTINTRVNPYSVTAPKRLLIDRVDKNTLDANNTSDVEISVNAGNLVISSNTEISSVGLTGQIVDLNLNSNKITNLANPTAGTDAANKAYVDEVAQGIIAKPSVLAATTQNLAGTYDNGTLGVGGTLNLGSSATLDVDGVTTWSQYDGILVKDQTNAEENGRYYVSQVGDASTDWILTRCMYCDEADEIPGAYVFVASGTANEGTGWVQVVADPSTFVVGTDSISVYQFSSSGSVGAGDGLTQNGNALDVNVDNSSIEIDVNDNLKIKSSGVTSAMLAGSIANSKLNQLTTANKVALSSMDIDGASELNQAITDSDLLIVDNGGTGVNSSLLASRIPEYTFGKVTGDASITSAGSLSLSSTAITGQTAKTVINDNDIILIADSEDSNSLKKMTRANFVSGLAASSFSSNLVPDSANTYSLGSSAAEWSDLYLGDSAYIYFGNDQDIILRHDLLNGLILQDSAGGSTRPHLTLRSSNSEYNSTGTLRFDNFSTTPAANDKILSIMAAGRDNAGVGHNYARIGSEIVSPVNGAEAGRLTFGVTQAGISIDNTSSIGLVVEGSSSGGVNVEIPTHDGSSQGLVLGSTLLTSLATELNVLDISTESPSDDDVLTYTAANGLHWAASSGNSVDLTNIASNVLPDSSNTRSLGSTTREWSDLYLGDSSRIYFGNDQDVYLEHDPDDGIQLHMSSESQQEPSLRLVKNNTTNTFQGPILYIENTQSQAPTDIAGTIRFTNAGTVTSYINSLGRSGAGQAGSDLRFYVANQGNTVSHALHISGYGNSSGTTVNIVDHDESNTGLKLGNTLVKSSASELNALDVSTENPSDDDVLTYTSADGLHWAASSGSSVDLTNISSNVLPDSSNTRSLGSTSAEWSDLYLGDSSRIYFGNDQDVYLEHDPDDGIQLHMTSESAQEPAFSIIHNNSSTNYQGASLQLHNTTLDASTDLIGSVRFIAVGHHSSTITASGKGGGSDTGSDIAFYVCASGQNSSVGLEITGKNNTDGLKVRIPDHNGSTTGLVLGNTLVTALGSEINKLDGLTATTAELNILDGTTVTSTELNALDVSAENPSDNDVLTYTSANGLHWAAASGGGGASAPTVITDSSGTNTTISTTSGIEEIHLISNGSNAVTITLPAAATAGSGYKYNIKQLGTANVTIDANGSETIDGSLTFVISSQYSSVTLVTDGSNWFVI